MDPLAGRKTNRSCRPTNYIIDIYFILYIPRLTTAEFPIDSVRILGEDASADEDGLVETLRC